MRNRRDQLERLSYDKILDHLRELAVGLSVDVHCVAGKVVSGIHDGVLTRELDDLAADTCKGMISAHPDYDTLAFRVSLSSHRKDTPESFFEAVGVLHRDGKLTSGFHALATERRTDIEARIRHSRDDLLDYFGFKTLQSAYLLRDAAGRIVERPQHLWMRVALSLHPDDLDAAFETYDLMSQKYFVHATPTLFNAGSERPQLSSCFLLGVHQDSIAGIFGALGKCAEISKYSGGIGFHAHEVRSAGSLVKGNNGRSGGIVPMLRVFNNAARYVDQGNRRNGAWAVYVEPWHPDIEDYLKLRTNQGDEDKKARDLFVGLWVPDLFMRRLEGDAQWSLFDPHDCPGLSDVYGDEFDALYHAYEKQGRARRTLPARHLFRLIADSLIETGMPYVLFKDSVNRKSNQSNVGVIKSSNLCTEITLYTSESETAVCNLASLGLPSFLVARDAGAPEFDFAALARVVTVVTRNLNKVIDANYYPVEEARTSNLRHRPIGIGVQGLSDVYIALGHAFDSPEAAALNRRIFATVYHAALRESVELAKAHGPYPSFAGSPASRGVLQFDMWGVTPEPYDGLDWARLKEDIATHGLRNSMLVAPMPTASTSQILGNTECFEPLTAVIYKRKTLAGEFVVVNRSFVREMIRRGLWSSEVRDKIIYYQGSVQQVPEVPADLKTLYRTVWDMSQKALIDQAAARGAFVCQSQSMNLYMPDPTQGKVYALLMYGWKAGLKTGVYYLRSRSAAKPQNFSLDPALERELASPPAPACDRDGGCVSCSS